MTEKQYENLSRKEVTLQLKLVSESLEKIKKSHEEINTNHKQLKISQIDNQNQITNTEKELKKAKEAIDKKLAAKTKRFK